MNSSVKNFDHYDSAVVGRTMLLTYCRCLLPIGIITGAAPPIPIDYAQVTHLPTIVDTSLLKVMMIQPTHGDPYLLTLHLLRVCPLSRFCFSLTVLICIPCSRPSLLEQRFLSLARYYFLPSFLWLLLLPAGVCQQSAHISGLFVAHWKLLSH